MGFMQQSLAEGIVWPDNAPSAEEYFAALDRQQQLEALLAEWSVYRNDVLGGIRDRYETDDPAMTKEELERALEDIERLAPAVIEVDLTDPGGDGPIVAAPSATVIPTALR